MVKKLYLDGCSFIYGQGIPRDKSLGKLFSTIGEYDVLDQSRCGKSNISIAVDTYKNWKDFDVFVLGFTFSTRFGLEYQNQNIDFYTGFHGRGLNLEPEHLDTTTLEIYKYFYSVFGPPYCDNLSNMLIDTLIAFLQAQNKKIIALSWEQRNTENKLFYPYIGPKMRLPDTHLSIEGTRYLFELLQEQLDE
jgi:hypothetical protein